MPATRELAGLKNGWLGFCVDSQGGFHGAAQVDVLARVAENSQMPADALEHFIEGRFSILDCQVRVHCFSKDPLRVAFNVANADAVIEEDWWER